MTGQTLERSAASILVLIVPFAVAVIFLYSAWPFLLALLLIGLFWNIWQQYQWKQWSQQVNPFFSELLKENQGCLTCLDLAIKANIPLEDSQRFLDRKAEEYGAQRKIYQKRGTVYYFLTASALGTIFDASEPLEARDAEAMSKESVAKLDNLLVSSREGDKIRALIQVELAKRLEVHSGTISKRKTDPDFSQWTKSKDPEGIAWRYSPKSKLFIPLS